VTPALLGYLGNVGNLSSATILFILQGGWKKGRPCRRIAVASAFVGFSAEFLLLQWT